MQAWVILPREPLELTLAARDMRSVADEPVAASTGRPPVGPNLLRSGRTRAAVVVTRYISLRFAVQPALAQPRLATSPGIASRRRRVLCRARHSCVSRSRRGNDQSCTYGNAIVLLFSPSREA